MITVYVQPNFKTKKALREAVKAGAEVEVFQPGGLFPATSDGVVAVEGPHYPEPHRWYAQVQVRGGRVVKVVS